MEDRSARLATIGVVAVLVGAVVWLLRPASDPAPRANTRSDGVSEELPPEVAPKPEVVPQVDEAAEPTDRVQPLSPSKGVAATAPAESPKVLIPSTRAERMLFCRTVLARHSRNVVSEVSQAVRERLQKKMRADLSPDEQRVVSQLIESAVSLDLTRRINMYEAIADYVQTADDLAKPARPTATSPGKSGTLSHGVTQSESESWEGAQEVTVRYFLSYDKYPALAKSTVQLREVKRQLSKYFE